MKKVCLILSLLWGVGTVYAQDDFMDEYNSFKKESKDSYDKFRQRANKEYAEFMEKAWKSYGIQDPIKIPKRIKMDPVKYDKVKEQNLLLAKKRKLQEQQTPATRNSAEALGRTTKTGRGKEKP